VRYYEQQSGSAGLVFAEPELVGEMGSRMSPSAADWDQDGYPDVLGVASSGEMELYLNRGSKGAGRRFAAGTKLEVPPVPYWPAVNVVDWNGDGDQDLMIATNYRYFIMVERSYLEHGYAEGIVLSVQNRKTGGLHRAHQGEARLAIATTEPPSSTTRNRSEKGRASGDGR
jgi:FG-GAP-like repeat